jgi:hypothetical protein
MGKVTIDIIAEDPKRKEWVLYLVEEGPWRRRAIEDRLRTLQNRIYDAVDVVLGGHLASKFPDSKGRSVRIQVDCYDEPPADLGMVVREIARFIKKSAEYQTDIKKSEFTKGIRIVIRTDSKKRD